jgi:Ca2+-binding RTX toxin-like protein
MARALTTFVDDEPVGWLETLDTVRQLQEQQAVILKTIVGTPGDDKLRGGKRDDDIDGLAGADTMVGRLGDDTYHVDNAGDVVKERAGEGTDTVVASLSWTLGRNVENLTLTGWENLVGTGNGLDNRIVGNSGENLLEGRAGDDWIDSGGSIGPFDSDTLVGGQGNDTLVGGQGYIANDLLQGGEGDDVLLVDSGASTLDGGDGNDSLTGGSGNGQHRPGFDTLIGGAGRDTLEGGSYADGGDGADEIHFSVAWGASGGAGNDTITGGGGAGYDDLTVDAGLGNDSVDVTSLNNDLFLYGGEGDDELVGSSAINLTIDAGAGDDEVLALGGRYGGWTSVSGGDGNDTIVCQAGYGQATVDGGAGDDVLSGGAASGRFLDFAGGLGSDTLFSGSGIRHLSGGADADRFVLTVKEILGIDTTFVSDFASGVDELQVSQASLAVGNGDLVVDGAVAVSGPGGFDASAELVIVQADVAGGLTLSKAAAAIGSANGAYAAGQSVVFMVDDGTDSWALYFQSSGNDAAVSADELSIIARLDGTASTGIDDIVWAA